MSLKDIQYGTVLTFETTLGERYRNHEYVGFMDNGWNIATKLGVDVIALDNQYRPSMVEPAPATFKDYPFVTFKTPEGDYIHLGLPWIKESTIEIKNAVNYQITLEAPTELQLNTIKSVLSTLGIINYKVDRV